MVDYINLQFGKKVSVSSFDYEIHKWKCYTDERTQCSIIHHTLMNEKWEL